MSFLAADRLWLLWVVAGLLGGYLWLLRRRGRYAVRFTNLALLDSVAPHRANWRQHVAVGLALLTLAGSIILFAKPAGNERVPRTTPVTVVLTMDVSLSMEATDVPPSRIAAAKKAAEDFLGSLPSDFRVALVSFAHYAHVDVPPTTDRARVRAAIERLKLHEYTATGEGIYTALQVIEDSEQGQSQPGQKKPAFILMISDGKRTVGRSQVGAAEAAKAQGVPIYTVALGTPDATVTTKQGVIPVPVETGELAQVSHISGGKAYVASTPSSLVNAWRDVHGQLGFQTIRTDITSHYIGWLVLLCAISGLAGLFVAARWP